MVSACTGRGALERFERGPFSQGRALRQNSIEWLPLQHVPNVGQVLQPAKLFDRELQGFDECGENVDERQPRRVCVCGENFVSRACVRARVSLFTGEGVRPRSGVALVLVLGRGEVVPVVRWCVPGLC